MRSRESEESSEEVRRREKEITLLEAYHALALWLYNLSPEEKVDMVYGRDIHPRYKEEKVSTASMGFAFWWGCLDNKHKNSLIDAVLTKFAEEARS